MTNTQLDVCDYDVHHTSSTESDACNFIREEKPTSTWDDEYRRMSERCENDKSKWRYETSTCVDDSDAADFFYNISYICLEYSPIDYSIFDVKPEFANLDIY